MRCPILLLAALLAASMFAPFRAASALDAPRALSGRQLQLMLTGNTIIGMGDDGPFWMYYPDPRTLWGRSAAGDVDVGTWWVENDQYCRSWRRLVRRPDPLLAHAIARRGGAALVLA